MTALTGEDEVADLCRDLIRIDSRNAGDNAGPGERKAAEYVAEKLTEVGLDALILESDDRRANVVARIEGEDPSRGALLLHGHLDVVPFDADDWRHHPLSGEIADGCVWGRGAVDMKDMDAMILAVARQRVRERRRPPRDVVLMFTADEEAGGAYGAKWLVDNHAGLFEGVTEAIGEVGGFSVSLGDRRVYLIEAAEKGMAWMRLTAKGRAGHGSMLNADNAVTELAEAVGRVGRHEWPVRLTPTVKRLLEELEIGPDDVDKLGPLARMIGAALRNTANPTMLQGGYKANVIPQNAQAVVDGRFLPGFEEEYFATIDELLGPNVSREFVQHQVALEFPFEGPLVSAMAEALLAEDPAAKAVPYTLSGGTDLKAFSRLGITGYGFAPLRLPADLDFSGMFHGVDERVPVDSLRFGVRVLDRFLGLC
ncbi:M20/M25/M40 family metallo-hydrolase [Nonomuraea sp. NPDC059194]|uniref:M20/M25/M40 family metallo-hydrolase n=1 Tax=Nonomuraea sp. NPDC059194 TaxID=3346764 RepID=UPI0036C53FBA